MFRCNNPNSIFKGILSKDIINGVRPCGFVFYVDSENCFWPLNTSLYELLTDSWEICHDQKAK